MEDQTWLNQEAQKSLERILSLLEEKFVHRMPVKELVVSHIEFGG